MLLLGGDLNARARLEGAADAIGATWETVSADSLLEKLGAEPVDTLIVDLDTQRRSALPLIGEARDRGILPARVIGYYSHVDTAAAQEAREAGVKPVKRGRFWTGLASFLSDD